MAKMTVETPKKTEKRKVEHIHVQKAANGYSVDHRLEPPKSAGANLMGTMQPSPAPAVFSGNKAQKLAMAHVSDLMAQMHDRPETEPAQAIGPESAQ